MGIITVKDWRKLWHRAMKMLEDGTSGIMITKLPLGTRLPHGTQALQLVFPMEQVLVFLLGLIPMLVQTIPSVVAIKTSKFLVL
ncbi:hypothetical protein HUJ04_008251 [Dendroctonus ponderosae]